MNSALRKIRHQPLAKASGMKLAWWLNKAIYGVGFTL
jgi:hypothetical protein